MECNNWSLRENPRDADRLIGFIGGPGTGKDTIADLFCATVSNSCHKVVEFAREFIARNGNNPTMYEQIYIFHNQKALEDEALQTYQYCVSPSPTYLSYIYALRYAGFEDSVNNMEGLSYLYKCFLEQASIRRYAHLFLCEPLSCCIDDGLRKQDGDEALIVHDMVRSLLKFHDIPYVLLPSPAPGESNIDHRLNIVMTSLNAEGGVCDES